MFAQAKTLITLATYNEIENLPQLFDEIIASVPQVDVLVIDDNSPDGTGRWCDEMAAQDSRLHCLHRPGKLGLGTATIAGMQYALAHSYTYVLNMDADFSHHPRHLPALIEGMDSPQSGSFDVMIGSRYVAGGEIVGWPLRRHLMSKAVNGYARWLLGLRVRDCSGAFRCYRTDVLKRIDFESVRSRGYSFQEEILWRLVRAGARMGETPVRFADRERGQSKINLREGVAAVLLILRLGISRLRPRPRA